jgi:isopentenyl-diphosphate delta-isomerase type 1
MALHQDVAPVSPGSGSIADHVVLLDSYGRPSGTAPKGEVHGVDTPFHLGFSCHAVDRAGRVLVTRRAPSKQTWPGSWTNACCGHPRWGESLRGAVTRRLREELGVRARRLTMALPDFAYRAVMSNGIVEHELCPVVLAEVDAADLSPDPSEVADLEWWRWDALRARARTRPESLTPWSARQVDLVADIASYPAELFGLEDLDDVRADLFAAVSSSRVVRDRTGTGDPWSPILGELNARVAEFVAARSSELVAIASEVEPVVAEIASLIDAGGKRLRPAFLYWGARAGGLAHDPDVVTIGAALEMLHTFALLHDDVMDRAERRRGLPSAARSLARMHARERLGGDGDRFGANAAILAGDLAFVWADELFDQVRIDPTRLARARAVFHVLRAEVMTGQYLDLRNASLPTVDEERARRVALLKSGRYTVTRPLQVGLALAGNDDPLLARQLEKFGDAVGIAFQMRDDILGVFGDEVEMGKSCAEDLREGKRTMLVVRALALLDGADRQELERCLGNTALAETSVRRCRELIAASGSLASIEALVRAQHRSALDALVGVAEPARSALATLASAAIERGS